MKRKPTTIDEYLAALPAAGRAALGKLRKVIRSSIPDARECISYGMPAFRVRGRVVAGFAATAKGYSYYPFSGSTLGTLAGELAGYQRTKSALHVPLEASLPAALVRKLIAARVAERASPARKRGGGGRRPGEKRRKAAAPAVSGPHRGHLLRRLRRGAVSPTRLSSSSYPVSISPQMAASIASESSSRNTGAPHMKQPKRTTDR